MHFVDHDQTHAHTVVGMAGSVGDPRLRHPGSDGDTEVASELRSQGFRARGGRDQYVRDRHQRTYGRGRERAPLSMSEVTGTPHAEPGSGLPGCCGAVTISEGRALAS